MKKAYIFAILAVILLFGCLSGCSKPANSTEPSAPTAPTEEELTPSEQIKYIPQAFTLNLYDMETNTYSFVWNVDAEPLNPVIQLCQGETFDEATAVNHPATLETLDGMVVCKVRIALEAGKPYSYRIYDTRAKMGSAPYQFTARDPQAEKFTFVHLSDSQVYDYTYQAGIPLNTVLEQLAARETPPAFLLHTGDFVHYGSVENMWRNMLNFSVDILSGIPFATVAGNHEMVGYGGGQYDVLKHFDAKMPQQDCTKGYYYSFDYGNVRFIQISTNDVTADYELSQGQYDWLVEQLETNDKKWTIVGMHHGMYSVGEWGNNKPIVHITTALRNQLSDLFAQYGVDLVLQGHDHTYSYTYPIAEGHTALKDAETDGDYFVNPQGVVYGMHGPAGDQAKEPWETYEDFYKFAGRGKQCSWAEITVEEDRLTVTVKNCMGGTPETVTTYGIIKN